MKFKNALNLGVWLFIFYVNHTVRSQDIDLVKATPYKNKSDLKTSLIDLKNNDLKKKFLLKHLPVENYKVLTGEQLESAPALMQRGPYNVGGRVRSVAIDRRNEDHIFAGGISGGLWESENRGYSWKRVTPIQDIISVSSIVQDVNNSNIWYFGSGENTACSLPGLGEEDILFTNGIYRSDDNGTTWRKWVSEYVDSEGRRRALEVVYKIVANPKDGSIWIAHNKGIGKINTQNRQVINSLDEYNEFMDIACSVNGALFATKGGNNIGIYHYNNNTRTWDEITPAGYPSSSRVLLAIEPVRANNIPYAVYFYSENRESMNNTRLMKCEVNGRNYRWLNKSGVIRFDALSNETIYPNFYYGVISIKPDDPNTIFFGGVSLYRTTDAFESADNISMIGGYYDVDFDNNNLMHVDQHCIAYFPSDPNQMLVGNDGGVFTTMDNSMASVRINAAANGWKSIRWKKLSNGLITTQAYAVAISPNANSTMVAAGFQDNGSWISMQEGHNTWQNIGGGDGGYPLIYDDRNTVIASVKDGHLYRNRIVRNTISNREFFEYPNERIGDKTQQIIRDPLNSNVIYMPTREGILKFTNIQNNWLRQIVPGTQDIVAKRVEISADAQVFYFTNGRSLYKLNGGVSTSIGPGIHFDGDFIIRWPETIQNLCIDPLNRNRLLVITEHNIFYSKNGGDTWFNITGNLSDFSNELSGGSPVRFFDIEIHRVVERPGYVKILLGTDVGLLSTKELNLTNNENIRRNIVWKREAIETIGVSMVSMIQSRSSDGYCAIATYGNGIFTGYIGLTEYPARLRRNLESITLVNNEVPIQLDLNSYFENANRFSVINEGDRQIISSELNGNLLSIRSTQDVGFTTLVIRAEGDSDYTENTIHVRVVADNGYLLQQTSVNLDEELVSYDNDKGRVVSSDDFTIPGGEIWDIDNIAVKGSFNGSIDNIRTVHLTITDNKNNQVVLRKVYNMNDQNMEFTSYGNNLDFSFNIDDDIAFSSGQYWVSVSVKASGIQDWKWLGFDQGSGNAFMFNHATRLATFTDIHLYMKIKGKVTNMTYEPVSFLRLEQRGLEEIALSWGVPEYRYEPLGFVIERSCRNAAYAPICFVPFGSNHYIDYNTFEEGARYNYRIKVIGALNDSRYQNASINFLARPEVPQNFRMLVATHNTISLTWDRGNERVEGYKLYRFNINIGRYELLAEIDRQLWIYNDRVPKDGTRYFYYLEAYNSAGSVQTNFISASSMINTPNNLRASYSEGDLFSVYLNWSDNSEYETRYRIFRSRLNNGNYTAWEEIAQVEESTTLYRDRGVDFRDLSSYRYYVIAENGLSTSGRSNYAVAREEEVNGIIASDNNPTNIKFPNVDGNRNRFSKFNPLNTDHEITNAGIFPNPVKTSCLVSLEEKISGEVQVTIYDLKGQRVLLRNINVNHGLFEMDVYHIPSGQYLLHVFSEGKIYRHKLIKE